MPINLTTSAPGPTYAKIQWGPVLTRVGPRSVRVEFFPFPDYAERWYGIYVNGIFRETVYAELNRVATVIIGLEGGEATANVFIEDFGMWSSITESEDPYYEARDAEAVLANRLSFSWTAPTSLTSSGKYVTTGANDTQLTSFTVTGAKRSVNVQAEPLLPTRGKLYYSIHESGGDYTVRFWKDNDLVAEGTRTGNGAVTCSEMNESGLEVTCTITFTAEVQHGDAWIDLMWPDSYQVHYSTSALIFPFHSANAVVIDLGSDEFSYRTPALAAGTYEAAIVPVRDGVAQSAGITTITGLVLNTTPTGPSSLGITGNAAAPTLTWVAGTAGSTYTVYYSKIGGPINFGDFALPAPITTGVDATSQVLAAITGYPGFVHAVVRASLGGIEESADEQLQIEFDENGDLVGTRPNKASITKLTMAGADLIFTLDVEAAVLCAESEAQATNLQLFVEPIATPFDFTDPDDDIELTAPINGLQRGTLTYQVVGAIADGWYHVAVRSVAASGALSPTYGERYIYLTNDAPGAASNISIEVCRGEKN